MLSDKAALALINLLSASGIYPPEGVTIEQIVTTWRLLLPKYDDQGMTALIALWLRSEDSKYGRWPTPGALLAIAPHRIDDPNEAWGDVLVMVRTLGLGCEPSWRGYHQIIARIDADPRCEDIKTAVKALGGWRVLALAQDGTLPSHRSAFCRAYQASQQGRRRVEELQQLERLRLLEGPGQPWSES